MSDKTSIGWTASDDGTPGATWNPVKGTAGRWTCQRVSPGCQHCYAARMNVRFGGPEYVAGADTPRLDEVALTEPLRWRRPRRIFSGSMTDLAWDQIPFAWLDDIYAVMAAARHHTFIVVTKRPERLHRYLIQAGQRNLVANRWEASPWWGLYGSDAERREWAAEVRSGSGWPLPNVWTLVSAENQHYFDERVPWLLKIPSAVRGVSLEPLLGPVDMRAWGTWCPEHDFASGFCLGPCPSRRSLDWVITGGESGGSQIRQLVRRTCVRGVCPASCPCGGTGYALHPEALVWLRAIRDQCQAAGVPFFHKAHGGPRPTSGGRLLDGREWSEFPVAHLRRGMSDDPGCPALYPTHPRLGGACADELQGA